MCLILIPYIPWSKLYSMLNMNIFMRNFQDFNFNINISTFLMFFSTVYRVYRPPPREPIILFHSTHAIIIRPLWCQVSCIPLRKLVFILRFTFSSLSSCHLSNPLDSMESKPRHEGISFLSPDISYFWLPWVATVDEN